MAEVLKLHPGWQEAARQIVVRTEAEGYGLVFSFEELFTLMDLKEPQTANLEEWRRHSFEKLQYVENLKSLLLQEHNLCLQNIRGVGYQVLHPDDQVTVAIDRDYRRIGRMLCKIVNKAIHVNQRELSFEGQQHQMRQLERAAFLKAVMGKGKKLAAGGEGPPALPEK
jgi:hypothetical protein